MQKTAVGLLTNPADVESVVREIEALGFDRNEIQTAEEPTRPHVSGVMSFPRLEYELELGRILNRMGATKAETEAYIDGLRHGGALVLATDEDENKVDAAADVLERHGAVIVEETPGAAPHLPFVHEDLHVARHDRPVQAGRTRQPSGGARFFVW